MDNSHTHSENTICSTGSDAPDAPKKPIKKLSLRQSLPIVFIVISIVWIFIGLTEFGFFNKLKGGTPGFVPIIAASILLVSGIVALAQSFREEAPKLNLLCFAFLAMCGAIVGLSFLIGLLPALLLFAFAWIKIIEKNPWKGTLIVLAVLAAIGYGLFEFALNVPFPKGMLFEMLF